MMWDWRFTFEEVIPRLLAVIPVTIEATVLGFGLAVTLGLGLAVLRMARSRWIAVPVYELSDFIRGTPLLVQIFFLFFILPGAGIVLPPFTTGVIALGLHYATYCSEVYRSGLENVPRGQWEAARALNLGTFVTFRDIIIPQAIPPVIPALGNYLISMFKETPLLALVAVNELMQEAKLIGSESFRYTEPITLTGVFFFAMSLTCALLIRRIEHWFKRRVRQR
jgi:polar amino acid transport system permease protein